MINYNGHEELIRKVYDQGQSHVFRYWDMLNEEEKKSLMKQLNSVDFNLMNRLFSEEDRSHITNYTPAPTVRPEKFCPEKIDEAYRTGEEHISSGKMAAFLVAGGQGSRLGYEGPKGIFPIGPVSGKSLFHFHGEKIRAYEIKYGVKIPFLVMTSVANHDETVEFFKKNSFFGLDSELVFIFPQNMIPSLDLNGKLIMESKSSIFMNPDGHGGSLSALKSSGALESLNKLGIETVSYFQVDNPLVKILDPVFTGFHIMESAEISSKAIPKAYAEEKTGVFIKTETGKTGIVEYSDMPDEKLNATDQDGRLLYSAGNTAIHLFNTDFINRITDVGDPGLPYHRAIKKIEACIDAKPQEIEGIKYEKFIFDALPICKKDMIYETVREEEFAPVKNAEGKDSPATAKELISSLCRHWLTRSGVKIPERTEIIEISPLFSVDGKDIKPETVIPDSEKVYLEKNVHI